MATQPMLRMGQLIQVVQEATYQDCNANAGARGGNPGQNGSNASYNGGQAGRYIWGNNYVKSWISTGDRVEGGLNVRSKARTSIQSIWC